MSAFWTKAVTVADSIFNQSKYRTYFVHLPTNYSAVKKYPLVLSLHGVGSNAFQQEYYSGFDAVADTADFIVVYPNGVGNAWNIQQSSSSPDDVNFISSLIDSLATSYSVDTACVFSTGLSMGGFMSNILACSLSTKIKAIGVVAGNITVLQQLTCTPPKGVSVIHFHGTSDNVVIYNGASGQYPSTTAMINWWVGKNNCTTTPITTSLPNTNTSDGCTVEKNVYPNGKNNSEVVFYKITGGGHTWPGGTVALPGNGNTCYDINASQLMWAFFKKQCSKLSSVDEQTEKTITIYPNPAMDNLTIANTFNDKKSIEIVDVVGNICIQQQIINGENTIDVHMLSAGSYFLRFVGEQRLNKYFIKK